MTENANTTPDHDDVTGHGIKVHGLLPEADDVEGHGARYNGVDSESTDDVEGHGISSGR